MRSLRRPPSKLSQMLGNSASFAASSVRNAAKTWRSAAMISGRRSSNELGSPAATGGGSGAKAALISISAAG